MDTGRFRAIALATTPHPLEVPQSDPLLPASSNDRPLSAFEIGRIEREIERINQKAEAQLAAGKIDEAFNLWYRELRLQRAIGTLEEVAALGRIGNLAWQQNRGLDTRAIAKRLAEIRTNAAAEDKLNLPLLKQLGMAYQQVRYLDRAIEIYQQIVVNARQTDALTRVNENLQILAELYLDLFDYPQAAEVYQELLVRRDSGVSSELRDAVISPITQLNPDDEVIYLTKLATIYDRIPQIEKAIEIKHRLAKRYLQVENIENLSAVYLAIARDYKELNNYSEASNYYQQAYNLATNARQLASAIEILAELAHLYRQEGRLEEAIATYKRQIELQQQAYDYYGWMETCDLLGKIYWDLKNYSQAQTFYRQGLELARTLNYRVGYFTEQLEQIEQL
ncbi:tetratricopeptide repeat protein [Myxosarcina sp. GI1(2024)]